MPGLFQSLDIARRALWASQLGMDVTSHNIANVNTLGYSRQRVNNSTVTPLDLPQGQLGLGVKVEDIVRIRNNFLDTQYREAHDKFGYANVKETIYIQLESILQEPGETSISSLMDQFFLEFTNLAADPENMATRNTIREKAKSLVEGFRTKYGQLKSLTNSIKNDVNATISQINEISQQIANLNKQIVSAEAGKGHANDLRDKRDRLLDSLSEYLKINVSEGKQGQVTVSAEGLSLVSGEMFQKISLEVNQTGDHIQLSVSNEAGKENNFKYGKLGGLLEMANRQIPEIEAKLNTLVYKISDHVNNIHSAGQTLPVGNPPTINKGINFFVGTSMVDFDLSAEVQENLANIAASGNGKASNGDAALSIGNIRNNKLLNGGQNTFSEYYSGIIQTISFDMNNTSNTRSGQELLLSQVENQRQSESGVSLDEEMTHLIQFQRSYEAAAKVIQAIDEMMETLVNIV
jgi:flagellar hook-associated protein 1 FlgK